MGRGDKRSRKGKIVRGTNGKTRPSDKNLKAIKKAAAAKASK